MEVVEVEKSKNESLAVVESPSRMAGWCGETAKRLRERLLV